MPKLASKKKPLLENTEGRITKKQYSSDLGLNPGKYVVREYTRDKWFHKNDQFFVKLYCLDDNREYKVRAGDKLTEMIEKALNTGKAQFTIDVEGSAYIKDDWKTKDLLLKLTN